MFKKVFEYFVVLDVFGIKRICLDGQDLCEE